MPNETRAIAELATLRRRVPLTQGELAAAAGVSVGTVRPRVIRALAAALGVDPAVVAEFRPSLGLPLPSSAPATETFTDLRAEDAQRRRA
jgi:hypothetical protein